jgi:serine/threonine protein kinase
MTAMRAITSRGAKGTGTRNTGRNRWSSAGARYEVLERAGEGTVFVVYRVRDKTNNRVLALKALKGGFNKHPRFAGALTVCAQRAAKFTHPQSGARR